MPDSESLPRLRAFAEDTAQQVGKDLLETFQHGDVTGTLKDDHTLVTEADHLADDVIRKAVKSTYPDHAVLSEESQTIYPDDATYVWVIDPLDGTTNFSQGLHHWGVSLGLLKHGIPAAAALCFPAVRELYSAHRHGGAALNGRSIIIRPSSSPAPHHFFLHCSRTHQKFKIDIPQKERTLGAAAYHFCAVGKGSGVMALETTVKLWDIAAAWLILEEAGGELAVYDRDEEGKPSLGKNPFPPEPGKNYNYVNFTVLAADTPYHLTTLVRHLEPR